MDARDDGTLSIEYPDALFPASWSEEKVARARTLFLKRLSVLAHRFYGGKLQVLPRAGLYGPGWFGAWYTPGVSAVSTAVRDESEESFALTGRGTSWPCSPTPPACSGTATADLRAGSASWRARPS